MTFAQCFLVRFGNAVEVDLLFLDTFRQRQALRARQAIEFERSSDNIRQRQAHHARQAVEGEMPNTRRQRQALRARQAVEV